MTINTGTLRQSVVLENPGAPVADVANDGGFTQTWVACVPSPVDAWIAPATVRELEKVAATIAALASHVVKIRYHPQVTIKTRVTWVDQEARTHFMNTLGVQNQDERNVELFLVCAEVLP